MSKVSYKSVLKQALAEFDTSKLADVKGPMLEPILSYTGEGELETHKKTAASVLERYYFQEKDSRSVSIPDTGESVDIKQPEKDDVSDGEKMKKATEKELEGKEGEVEKAVIESEEDEVSLDDNLTEDVIFEQDDSIESRLLELEETFLADIEDEAITESGDEVVEDESLTEAETNENAENLSEGTGPGGHVADGTGPHGKGNGPGKGKADGSGKEDEEEKIEESIEDRILRLEKTLIELEEKQPEGDAEVAAEKAEEKIAGPPAKEEITTESETIEDIESTVLEALISDMEDSSEDELVEAEDATADEDADKEAAAEETPTEEEKAEDKKETGETKEEEPVIDVDKSIKENGDALGPIGVTDEDVDLEEALTMLEAEMENIQNDDENLDIKVENIDKDNIKI